jgi:hypothetical protein
MRVHQETGTSQTRSPISSLPVLQSAQPGNIEDL